MQTYNRIGLRESLEQLETAKLDELLQAELEKKSPDPDSVRLIVSVLEDREASAPVEITAGEETAWQQYRKRMAGLQKKPVPVRRWLTVAASIVLIFGLLFAIVPQQVKAETFWEMLQRWSNTMLIYFSGEGKKAEIEYTFETENPGLQQVYDAVVELGVAGPVVPMWLPNGYEITRLETKNTPMLKGIFTWFSNENSEIVYKLEIYQGEPAHEFYRDDTHFESYEKNGTIYNITRNIDNWVVVYTRDNIEVTITADCQEDTLRRILGSIYVMEDD